MSYSFITGLWKSVKNTTIVLLPALGAGWIAFTQKVPEEYTPIVLAIGGFLAYFVKNYLQFED